MNRFKEFYNWKRKKLGALLKEGYQNRKEEGLALANEFESVDLEEWDDY